MLMRGHVIRTGLSWVMGLELLGIFCAVGLALAGVSLRPSLIIALSLSCIWTATALCWVAAFRVRIQRPEVLLAAAAVTSWTAGCTYYAVLQTDTGSVPYPSGADVGAVLFYALLAAALGVVVRRPVQRVGSSVWWAAAVGSLGAAAVLAVALDPVLELPRTGLRPLASLALALYPLCDLLLVVAVGGVAALGGVRMGSRWGLLVAGLFCFAVTDVVYSLRMATGSYAFGTPSDLGWGLGMVLMAWWVDGAAGVSRVTRPPTANGAMSLAVSSGATLAGLWVLLLNNWVPVSALALSLATVTLVAAAVRSEYAFRLVARLADQRRLAATTDELTGLPNRRALTAEAEARFASRPERRQALLVLDVDKLKEVNESLGHLAGDEVLARLGATLQAELSDGDLLARLGSDEFAVLLDDAARDESVAVAVRLQTALQKPLDLQSIALHWSVSIGVSLYPDDGLDVETLLRKASVAMHKGKASLTGHHVYSSADDAADATRLLMVEGLRTALATGQLTLHYQPKIDLATGDVRSVEALVRWEHPTRGLLYPDSFLPLVEEFALMPSLTQAVLAMVLDQIVAWTARGRPIPVSVNLSASSLLDDNLPEQVTAMLSSRGIPPHMLQLEITEEFLMADRGRARSILTRLRDSGVEISVDDYGAGYSSLSYLLDLPVDELKLDRSFVVEMADNARSAALVASTIALAHSLDLRMVAEGVETGIVFAELRRLGCDQGQGFFMSRPMPAAELDHWLDHRRELDPSMDLMSGLLNDTPEQELCVTVVDPTGSISSHRRA